MEMILRLCIRTSYKRKNLFQDLHPASMHGYGPCAATGSFMLGPCRTIARFFQGCKITGNDIRQAQDYQGEVRAVPSRVGTQIDLHD
jgi:hypothetical protein